MHKSIPSIVLISILLAGVLSGCGLIGGAFTLPEDDPNYTPGATAAAGANGNLGPAATIQTPLPLQSVTPLPTGVPQLPSDCVDALSVTIDDYGKSMCVGGIVKLITMEGGKYRVYFGERGKLYMLGLDWVDRIGLRAGDCAYAEGKLSRDGVAAVMPITPYTLKRCPVG